MNQEDLIKMAKNAHMKGQQDGFNMALEHIIKAIDTYKLQMNEFFNNQSEVKLS